MAFIFQATLYCDDCGRDIRKRLRAEGKAPADPSDEYSYDSDEYPKGPTEEGSSDSPTHCDSGEECVGDRVDLTDFGLPAGARMHGAETPIIGELLTDELTREGEEYVRESVNEMRRKGTPYQKALAECWAERFDWIEFDSEDEEDE